MDERGRIDGVQHGGNARRRRCLRHGQQRRGIVDDLRQWVEDHHRRPVSHAVCSTAGAGVPGCPGEVGRSRCVVVDDRLDGIDRRDHRDPLEVGQLLPESDADDLDGVGQRARGQLKRHRRHLIDDVGEPAGEAERTDVLDIDEQLGGVGVADRDQCRVRVERRLDVEVGHRPRDGQHHAVAFDGEGFGRIGVRGGDEQTDGVGVDQNANQVRQCEPVGLPLHPHISKRPVEIVERVVVRRLGDEPLGGAGHGKPGARAGPAAPQELSLTPGHDGANRRRDQADPGERHQADGQVVAVIAPDAGGTTVDGLGRLAHRRFRSEGGGRSRQVAACGLGDGGGRGRLARSRGLVLAIPRCNVRLQRIAQRRQGEDLTRVYEIGVDDGRLVRLHHLFDMGGDLGVRWCVDADLFQSTGGERPQVITFGDRHPVGRCRHTGRQLEFHSRLHVEGRHLVVIEKVADEATVAEHRERPHPTPSHRPPPRPIPARRLWPAISVQPPVHDPR